MPIFYLLKGDYNLKSCICECADPRAHYPPGCFKGLRIWESDSKAWIRSTEGVSRTPTWRSVVLITFLVVTA